MKMKQATTTLLCTILALLHFGCESHGLVRFALCNHPDVWRRFETNLQTEGIRCVEGDFNLGCMALLVDSRDFERARQAAVRLITRDSLTIRISKDIHSEVLEVYERGKLIRDESYSTKLQDK